jgi:hypothetical protein
MSAGPLSAELSLPHVLTAILKARLHSTELDASLLPAPDDLDTWRRLVAVAHQERVSPLLYAALKDCGACPPPALAQLQGVYYQTARHNTRLLHALDQIIAALRAAGIGVILLKGASAAERLYHNPALRPMLDMDLLVRPADIPAALETLQSLGYRYAEDVPFMGSDRDFRPEFHLSSPNLQTSVDLHWSLFQPWFYKRVIDPALLWSRAQPVRARAVGALELAPEENIVFLAAHRFKHAEQHLLWLYDIALIAAGNAGPVDWGRVLAYAHDWHLVQPTRSTLAEAARVFAAPVPADVLAALATMRPSLRERYELSRSRLPPAGIVLTLIAEVRDRRGGALFLLKTIFPSAEFMIGRYHIRHRWQVPFYYPYRLLRGLRKDSSPRKPA